MLTEEELEDNDYQTLLKQRGYIREALLLAKSRKKRESEPYDKKKPFINFSKKTKKLITEISKNLEAELDEQAFDDIDPDVFKESWNKQNIKLFFSKNKALKKAVREKILRNKNIMRDIENNKKIADRWKNWISEPLLTASETMHTFAYKFPFPPVDLTFLTLAGIGTLIGTLCNFQASRYNPGNKKLSGKQPLLISTSAFGGVALIGTILALVLTGPIITIVAPIIIAIGAAGVAISNVISFFKSLVNLGKTISNKENKESPGLRILQKSLSSFKLAASSLFYICVAILAVVAVVALFSNPIGLPALAAGMFAIAIVTSAVYIGSSILERITRWRIKKAESNLKKEKNLKPHKKSFQEKETAKKHITETPSNHLALNQTTSLTSKNNNIVHSGFHLMQDIAKHKPSVLVRTNPTPQETYETLAENSLSELKQKIETHPLYKNSEYRLDPDNKTDSHALIVEVHDPETGSNRHDKITRHQNPEQEVEIKLTIDPRSHEPTDNTIFILLDLNKEFSPLFMDHCGNPHLVLKIFEAAKLANIEITLDHQDREHLINNDDPNLKAYFNAIESWSTAEFQAYTKERIQKEGSWELGQIPEAVPHKPLLNHQTMTDHH